MTDFGEAFEVPTLMHELRQSLAAQSLVLCVLKWRSELLAQLRLKLRLLLLAPGNPTDAGAEGIVVSITSAFCVEMELAQSCKPLSYRLCPSQVGAQDQGRW